MHRYRSTQWIYPEGLAFFPPFLEGGHGAFVCDQDLALTVRIRDLNRRFGGLQVSPRLRFACCRRRYRRRQLTEAPAARDVDDAAPLVTAEGRLAATWAENPDAARA